MLVLNGEKAEFSPRFTFHGFRYAEITLSEKLEITGVKGVVLSENLTRTGYFGCENALANKIYENIYRGQTRNFIGLPLDCPQRDERIGWSGDAQIFFSTATYNADCERFYKNYIEILCDACLKNGRVPVFAPFFENHDTSRCISKFANDKELRFESATFFATMLYTLKGTPYILQGQEFGTPNAARFPFRIVTKKSLAITR